MASELTFEVGKCYKTRDGKKATVFLIRPTYMVGEIEGNSGPIAWLCDGSWLDSNREYESDLVAEWKEPPRWKLAVYECDAGGGKVYMAGFLAAEGSIDPKWKLAAKCEIVEGEGL